MGTYHLRSDGAVIDIINRRGRTRSRHRGSRHKRIIVWVSAILILGLVVVFGFSLGASLRRQSSSLQEKNDGLRMVLDENAKRQMGIQQMERDPSFLTLFRLSRGFLEDTEMYREILVGLFKLNSEEASRARSTLKELRPLYAEIMKYQDRVETGDLDEALFNGLKALMQTAFSETMARICGKPLTACRKWVEPFVEGPALPRQFSKPDVEI